MFASFFYYKIYINIIDLVFVRVCMCVLSESAVCTVSSLCRHVLCCINMV